VKEGCYALENSISIAVATQAGRTIDEDFPGGEMFLVPMAHAWLPHLTGQREYNT
jgi:hypothetical protein